MVLNVAVHLACWESDEKSHVLQIQYVQILEATMGHIDSLKFVQYWTCLYKGWVGRFVRHFRQVYFVDLGSEVLTGTYCS